MFHSTVRTWAIRTARAWALAAPLATLALAPTAQATEAEKSNPQQVWAEAIQAAQAGPSEVKLLDKAVLKLPDGRVFIPQPHATRLLQAMGNPGEDPQLHGLIFPAGDVDWYSLPLSAGTRFDAATMTSFGSTTDSMLTLYAPNGTTVIEADDDNGVFGDSGSALAGVLITQTGTHYVKVEHGSLLAQLRSYDLHTSVATGSPTPEAEPNDTFAAMFTDAARDAEARDLGLWAACSS